MVPAYNVHQVAKVSVVQILDLVIAYMKIVPFILNNALNVGGIGWSAMMGICIKNAGLDVIQVHFVAANAPNISIEVRP